jgi:hypothetical protein
LLQGRVGKRQFLRPRLHPIFEFLLRFAKRFLGFFRAVMSRTTETAPHCFSSASKSG